MQKKIIDEWTTAIVDLVKSALTNALTPRDERLATIERRIEQLETRPQLKWAGPFVSGVAYAESSLVTRSGSLWVAMKGTTEAPGASEHWKLVVKRGSYGHDVR